jgi:hypothetical protein
MYGSRSAPILGILRRRRRYKELTPFQWCYSEYVLLVSAFLEVQGMTYSNVVLEYNINPIVVVGTADVRVLLDTLFLVTIIIVTRVFMKFAKRAMSN